VRKPMPHHVNPTHPVHNPYTTLYHAHRRMASAPAAAAGKTKVFSAFEETVVKALNDIKATAKEPIIQKVIVSAAKEVAVEDKKAIVIFVPYRIHKAVLKVQERLIREFEKKFNGAPVFIVAQRKILPVKVGLARPHSRSRAAVHEAILHDLSAPSQIVGVRTRYRTDGSKILKVFLNPKDQKDFEGKLKALSSVYSALTSRAVEFTFPADD